MSKSRLSKFIKNYFETLGIIPSKTQTSKKSSDSSKFLERRKDLMGIPSKKQTSKESSDSSKFLERRKDLTGFLVGGQAKIDANKDGKISGEDFKILREKNKKKKGGVTSAIKKIRGIGMAKGGFKKKTPIY